MVVKKQKSSKFLSGALIGAALGVAAGIFANSKKGKEIKKEAKEKVANFYATLAPKIKNVKEVGEKEYKDLVNEALTSYNKKGGFSKEDVKHLTKHAHASWKHLKKHL